MEFLEQRKALADIGSQFHSRGWSVGTSSNYSVVVSRDPFRLLITASGKDKGNLQPPDFAILDADGKPVDPNHPKSSAETWLHLVLGQRVNAGAILHTHSIWGTLVSDWCASQGAVRIDGYEMLKGLEGITTHQTTFDLEIFDNTQDIPRLAQRLENRLTDLKTPLQYGFLLRRHGLYTWGNDLFQARRHVEIIEFLLECVGRQMQRSGK